MSDTISYFISYYKNLPKGSCVCRVFERSDSFCLYGDDAILINKVMPASQLKTMESGKDTLNYISLTKAHLIKVLHHLLFVIQYKVEILRNVGTVRSAKWEVVGKASPGNLAAVEELLFSEDNSYVMTQRGIMALKMSLEGNDLVLGIAYCDPILREIQICQFVENPQSYSLPAVLAQLSPQECLLPVIPKTKRNEFLAKTNIEDVIKTHNVSVSDFNDFNSQFIVQDLNRLLKFGEGQNFENSMKEESGMKLALSCVTAIIKYLELLNDNNNFEQYILKIFKSELFAKVDTSCEIGLSLFPEVKADYHDKTYLFGFLNTCFTGSGERLLMQWIKQPLVDVRKIEQRLDVVEVFVNQIFCRDQVSKLIEKFVDIEMLCRKIQRRKANLQDMYKIYQMISKLPHLKEALVNFSDSKHVLKETFIEDLQERIDDCENFVTMISQTLDFDAIQDREFIIKADYDESLLKLSEKINKIKKRMDSELKSAKEDLSLSSVKLELSDKVGYTFRITLKEESHLRNKKKYIVIETRNSGVKFQSEMLKLANEEYFELKKEYEAIQQKIVEQIVEVSASYIPAWKLLNNLISWLDVSLALSRAATNSTKTYIRPKLRENGNCHIVLKQCRHPVLEGIVSNYIPNDVEITKDKHRFYFVTGPNMGGKSTYIRSVALNVLLAQMGSFVPCDEADISVVDAFFTRIGACDKPSKAMSTFMYEMLEMKTMLKYATPSSLLIIDEMGRGTSTFDGLGLSWAISKHIAEVINSPCLFATHFHDLTDLSKSIKSISNLHVDAKCTSDDVTFMYRIKPGVCSESFGIHVAKLAAMPQKVIENAQKKLKLLEESPMSFEEISNTFCSVPQGEVLIQAIQEFYPTFSRMDIDNFDSTESITDDETVISSAKASETLPDLETSMADRILSILESMENETFKSH